MRFTPGGKAVATASLAVKRNKDQTDWIRIEAWERSAELLNEFFKTGDTVAVTGSLRTNSWEDQQGVKRERTFVAVDKLHFLGGERRSGNTSSDERSTWDKSTGEVVDGIPF